MRCDSYRFFVIKNEQRNKRTSANKIAVTSRHIIFEKIKLKVTKNGIF